MMLKDLKIGEIFRLTPKGIEWVKENEQGMDNRCSSIRSVKKFNTRAWRESHRTKVISQNITIYPIKK